MCSGNVSLLKKYKNALFYGSLSVPEFVQYQPLSKQDLYHDEIESELLSIYRIFSLT